MLNDKRERRNSLGVSVAEHINNCLTKSEAHRVNAKNAQKWHTLLTITNLIISSAQALTMTLQSVYGDNDKNIAVSGGMYAFLNVVFNRVQNSFNFNVLEVLHNQASDDYLELHNKFKALDIEADENEYKNLVNRYISVSEKSHLYNVRECHLLTGCC